MAQSKHYLTKDCLMKIIEVIDRKSLEFLYKENKIILLDSLKNALNLAIDYGKVIEYKDIQVIELLLKQIKFEYTVHSSRIKI